MIQTQLFMINKMISFKYPRRLLARNFDFNMFGDSIEIINLNIKFLNFLNAFFFV